MNLIPAHVKSTVLHEPAVIKFAHVIQSITYFSFCQSTYGWFYMCVCISGCLEEGLETLLKATGGNLLILKVSHCPNLLTDRSLWLASCYCRALQAVTYRSVHQAVLPCAHSQAPNSEPCFFFLNDKMMWIFSGVLRIQWVRKWSGLWEQVAGTSSPSRWHHYIPGRT